MKDNPKVPVIMGIYNCENTLAEAIDSILDQTYDNWELIMCDDGSTDGTLAAARAAAAMDGRANPLPEDVKRVAPLVMRHRIVLNFHAEAENVNADEVVKQIIDNG